MSRTNFTGPVSFGEKTGNDTTDTRAWLPGRKQVTLDQTAPSATITIPDGSTITKLAFVPTSAFTGTDPVSAMVVTFAQGTIVHGTVTASANTRYHETVVVSGAIYDTAAVMTITLSALSTTVFTAGGGRAFVDYITISPIASNVGG